MPRKVNGLTYREWRAQYLAAAKLTLPMDLDTKRRALYQACPIGFFPDPSQQRWQTFITMDSTADKRDGHVYLPSPSNGSVIVQPYVQLELDDFRAVCIRRATLAAGDLEAIREMVIDWADAHQQAGVNVDKFMDDVKRAAGL